MADILHHDTEYPSGYEQSNGSEMALVKALLGGDEQSFMMLVEEYQLSMLRLATLYVHSRAVAEEVVQDTWVAVLNGLTHFEGRSSLRT